MIGIDVAVQVGHGEQRNVPLIVTNSVGFPLLAGWGILSYIAVKHEHKGAWTLLAISLPLCLLVPVVNIVLGEQGRSLCMLVLVVNTVLQERGLAATEYDAALRWLSALDLLRHAGCC